MLCFILISIRISKALFYYFVKDLQTLLSTKYLFVILPAHLSLIHKISCKISTNIRSCSREVTAALRRKWDHSLVQVCGISPVTRDEISIFNSVNGYCIEIFFVHQKIVKNNTRPGN